MTYFCEELVDYASARCRADLAKLLKRRRDGEVAVLDTSIYRSFTKRRLAKGGNVYTTAESWAIEGAAKEALTDLLDDDVSAPSEVGEECDKHEMGMQKYRYCPHRALRFWQHVPAHETIFEMKPERKDERTRARKEFEKFIGASRVCRSALNVVPTEAYFGKRSMHLPEIVRAINSLTPPIAQSQNPKSHENDARIFAKAVLISYQRPACIITCDKGFFDLQRKLYERREQMEIFRKLSLPQHPVSVVYGGLRNPWVERPK